MITKRCTKCGRTSKVRPRERRCKQTELDVFSEPRACWGQLVKQQRKRVRRTLEQDLDAAHKQLTNTITRVKRAVTSVDHWQRKIKSIGRRIDERDHPKPKQPKPKQRTRIIRLPDDDEI